jgi:hypothetical protein
VLFVCFKNVAVVFLRFWPKNTDLGAKEKVGFLEDVLPIPPPTPRP